MTTNTWVVQYAIHEVELVPVLIVLQHRWVVKTVSALRTFDETSRTVGFRSSFIYSHCSSLNAPAVKNQWLAAVIEMKYLTKVSTGLNELQYLCLQRLAS